MDWTDCPIIQQTPGKMSGAPTVRGMRLRPTDIVENAELGVEGIVEQFGLPVEDVRTVLDFWAEHYNELPLEYFPPGEIAELGINDIDWSGCSLIEQRPERLSGAPVIRETQVRVVDLVHDRRGGESEIARVYDLPIETVRSVLGYYDQHHHKRQLASAV